MRTYERYSKNWFPEKSLGKKQVLGRKHPLLGYHGTKHELS